MNLIDVLLEDDHPAHAANRRIDGVVIGLVTNTRDPEGLGRVKVKFPWLDDAGESEWARVAAPMAGKERGLFFLPEVDDEVLIAFDHGDPRFPYVVGALWNGKDKPPAKNDDGKNNLRVLKSRSGHVIKLNDEDGKETVEIIGKGGKDSIVIDAAKNTVTITTDKDIALSAPNGAIKLDAKQVEIKSSAATRIESGGGMDVKANATMNIKGQAVNIN
ncbi:MAG TPA: phage baseplate assembly protein V [Blastocatellia bacterium]|nr:phage baseplate assembly protein V [Blastocatellia bacterium]